MSYNIHLVESLGAIGFTEKEANVYLSLLELGKGTVSEIARRANINRTTGYDILDNLVSKGLASITGKEPKQEYIAESPDKVVDLINLEVEKQRTHLEKAKTLVQELRSMHNQLGRPKIRFFEGTEGLEQVYEDTLTSHEPIRGYANVDDMHRALPHYFPKYYKRRAAKGIAIRGILTGNAAGFERMAEDKSEMRQSALVPPEYYFTPEIDVYDNKVMIASWKEKLGIIIESQEIADAMKKIYELAWAEAKRLDKEIRANGQVSDK